MMEQNDVIESHNKNTAATGRAKENDGNNLEIKLRIKHASKTARVYNHRLWELESFCVLKTC